MRARAAHPRLGYLLVVSAAIIFGVNGGVSRVPIHAGLAVETYTTVRVTGGFLAFALLCLVLDRGAFRMPRGRTALDLVVLGVLGVAFLQWTYNIAVVRLPLGVALLLEYLAPVYVVLWVRFVRRENVHPRVWPAIAVAIVGLALVGEIWDGLTLDGFGVVMAVLAGLCFALYFLQGERLTGTDLSSLQIVLWSFGVATIVMNLIEPAWNAGALGNEASLLGRFEDVTVPAWSAMVFVVIIGTVVPFFLYLSALRHLSSTVASVVAMLEPIVATLVGWAWFHEILSTVQVLGVLAVVAGIVLAQTARRVPEELPPTV